MSKKSETSQVAMASPTQIVPSPTPDPTVDWKVYSISSVGLSFRLPPQLSKQGEWMEEVGKGDKGTNFCFQVVKKTSFLFGKVFAGSLGACGRADTDILIIGGTSKDYEEGRGGVFTDYQGFTVQNGKYFARFVGGKLTEISSELVEVVENKNGVEIIKARGKSLDENGEGAGVFPVAGTPGEGYLGALVNTKRYDYSGVAIELKLNQGVSEEEFDQILKTFTFLDEAGSAKTPGKFVHSSPGYSFEYPTDWKVVDDTYSDFLVYSPDYKHVEDGMGILQGVEIRVSTSKETQSLDQIYSDYAQFSDNKKELLIQGVRALQYDMHYETNGLRTIFIKNGILYNIFMNYDNSDKTKYMDAYQKVLSSFAFTK